jgi:hypothetical protein
LDQLLSRVPIQTRCRFPIYQIHFEDLTKQVLKTNEVNPIKAGSLEQHIGMVLKKPLCRGAGISGGISKKQSRRNSFKSNESEDEEDGKDRKRKKNVNDDRINELMGLIPQEFFLIDKHESMLSEYEELIKSFSNADKY